MIPDAALTITEFLEARIAEDEAAAKHRDIVTFGPERRKFTSLPWRDPHDPARVLAECAAKRRAVEELSWIYGDPWEYGVASDAATNVLRALAAVYKGHPDYRQEWAA